MKLKNLICFVCISIALGSCVSPDLGNQFNPSILKVPDDAESALVIYADAGIEQGLYYKIAVNGRNKGNVFPGTFIYIPVDSGDVSIRAWETYDGSRGFQGGSLPRTFEPGSLFLGGGGIRERIEVPVNMGTVNFFRLRKVVEETFFECNETRDITSFCRRVNYPLLIDPVERSTAETELTDLRESL